MNLCDTIGLLNIIVLVTQKPDYSFIPLYFAPPGRPSGLTAVSPPRLRGN